MACKHVAKPTASPSPSNQAASELASPSAAPPIQLGPLDADRVTPHAFAFYQTWFKGPPDYGHWRGKGRSPEVVGNDGLPGIAAVHHPEIGPYDSADDGVLGYHLLLMRGAGFDGAVVGWHGERTPAESALDQLFAKARTWDERYGLRFSLMLMIDAQVYATLPPPARVDTLREDLDRLLATYGTSPVYQRLEGQPVVFFFPRPDPMRPNQPLFTPQMWARVRGGLSRAFRLAYLDASPNWQRVAEMPFAWVEPTGTPDDDAGKYLDWFYGSFAASRARGPLPVLAVGATYPGYDDAGAYGWSHAPGRALQIDRTIEGESTLARTWSHVFAYNQDHPDQRVAWVQTASWNDWNEGDEIEPGVERGTSDYEAAAAQNQRFTGVRPLSDAGLALGRAYLAGRHAGMPEAAFERALEAFVDGEPERVMAALPSVAPQGAASAAETTPGATAPGAIVPGSAGPVPGWPSPRP